MKREYEADTAHRHDGDDGVYLLITTTRYAILAVHMIRDVIRLATILS